MVLKFLLASSCIIRANYMWQAIKRVSLSVVIPIAGGYLKGKGTTQLSYVSFLLFEFFYSACSKISLVTISWVNSIHLYVKSHQSWTQWKVVPLRFTLHALYIYQTKVVSISSSPAQVKFYFIIADEHWQFLNLQCSEYLGVNLVKHLPATKDQAL